VGKVEAQTIGSDQRAFLHGLISEHGAQCRVQQVGPRVIADRRRAGIGVHG